MAAAFGVRMLSCGPNRLAVLAGVRPLLQLSPREVRSLIDLGEPVLLTIDVPQFSAEKLAREFTRLGASVEIFVSMPCPSDCCGPRNNEPLDRSATV